MGFESGGVERGADGVGEVGVGLLLEDRGDCFDEVSRGDG